MVLYAFFFALAGIFAMALEVKPLGWLMFTLAVVVAAGDLGRSRGRQRGE